VDAYHRWQECVANLLRGSSLIPPSAIAKLVNDAVAPVGATVTIYLVDREQEALRPMPDGAGPRPEPQPVDTTVAGRAFTTSEVVGPPGETDLLWVPVVNDSERLGVLALERPGGWHGDDPASREGVGLLSRVIANLLVGKMAYGDTIRQTRRSRPMATEAEMLWRTLPPLTCVTDQVAVAAVLEPCYDVGGDAFDYAIDHQNLRVGIFDAIGHGLSAALTSTLTLGATRAARASRLDLAATAAAADEAIASQFQDTRYTTAVLAELDTATGELTYLNAGHPPGVLLREGRVVEALTADPRPPLGMAHPSRVAGETLQPGDRLLFYSDGVTEARDAEGGFFGVDRLVDLAERQSASGLPAPEIMRRLIREVIDYSDGGPADDATLMLVEWRSRGG
jgi:phosphoserine phosphatase RsbU/P